jgi:hypothetical protein
MSIDIYQQYIQAFQSLDPGVRQLIRRVGALELQRFGCGEIGSSDVSCAVFGLYKRYGNWEDIIKHGLELIR